MVTDRVFVEVSRIKRLPEHFDRFLSEATAEGFNNMSVLRDEWADGSIASSVLARFWR